MGEPIFQGFWQEGLESGLGKARKTAFLGGIGRLRGRKTAAGFTLETNYPGLMPAKESARQNCAKSIATRMLPEKYFFTSPA
jgi:hypothetical protein